MVVKGERYPVDSVYSYPKGGDNRLSPTDLAEGEAAWKVQTRKVNSSTYRVMARGKYYSIQRTIKRYPNRVSVKDTMTNTSPDAIGIIFRNQIHTEEKGMASCYLAGYEMSGVRDIKLNPTVFIRKEGLGLGLIALDDVYIVQARGYYEKGRTGIYTDNFALDTKASYTVEWAIYPGSGDYYDFINQVKKDEGRNNVTVEGGLTLGFDVSLYANAKVSHPISAYRRMIPTKEFIELRGLKYFSDLCLSWAADDPDVSLEGIEFMEYPEEMKLLKEQFAAIHRVDSSLKVMFHVAHALYATDQPEEKFPDARVMDSQGKQVVYGNSDEYYYNGKYFSKERLDQGWRWWIFYPTLDNSFGKALLKSVDVMVDELGCNGAFMDGFMLGYGSDYTYDRWDGHSADIDPETRTIKRKKGSVILLSQEILVAFVRRFNTRGGTILSNGTVVTRTMAKEKIVYDQECLYGPDAHLTATPITLGNPAGGGIYEGKITEQDVYRDVQAALSGGNLYFYYREGDITYRSVPAQMFPITMEEIHSGYVKGKERLITAHSGLYGWHDQRDLHFGYLYDDTGRLIPNCFLTTVDGSGVRTQIDLKENQMAVLKRIPVFVRTDTPVNLISEQYDSEGIRLVLSGKGWVKMSVQHGDFEILPHTDYLVKRMTTQTVTSDHRGMLSFRADLKGELHITVMGTSQVIA